MEFSYKMLVCCECGRNFIFTKREQQLYALRGFKHYPKRCRICRNYRNFAIRSSQPAFLSAGIEKSLPLSDR